MSRLRPVALALALLALLGVAAPAGAVGNRIRPAPAYAPDGRAGEWRGTPTNLGGRTQLSRGELVHTDYLYDDYGPDLDNRPDLPSFRADLAPAYGDYRYPGDEARYGWNAADLRELRLAAGERALHVLVALQTMKVDDAAIAAIAIDTDGDARTGAPTWPHGAGIDTPGADRFVTLSGGGSRLTDAAGRVTPLAAGFNLRENALEATVPLPLLGAVSRDARMWAVVGLAGPTGGFMRQENGETAVFDVAFQADDTGGPRLFNHWADYRQSRALAARDVEPFSHPLDLEALQDRASRPFRVAPGYYNGIFRSRQDYGEGILLKQDETNGGSSEGTAEPQFRSPHQPYGLFVPSARQRGGKLPLLINGHSLDVNHNEYRTVSPNFLRQVGEERGSLIATPLARGIDTWYLDAGLLDVFEVWRDVRRRFHPDPERTALGGYSMGGYLSYRLGLLMPDAFSRVSVYVGPPVYSFWAHPLPPASTPEWRVAGNTNLIVDNGLNLPFEINHGNADELVPITGVRQQVETFRAAGNPFRFYHHQGDDHFTFILNDVWDRTEAWLGGHRRERLPVEVRYRRYPAMDLRHAGLVFDGAYWVDGIEVRDARAADAFGQVWATNFARGGHRRRVVDEGTTAVAGGGGASPGTAIGQHVVDGEPIQRANAFEARLDNVSAIVFETGLMGLDRRDTVGARLRGDGPTRVRLTGDWPARLAATLDGDPVAVTRPREGGIELALSLPADRAHELVVRPLLPRPRAQRRRARR